MQFSQHVRDTTVDFLKDLIRIPSTRGNEGPAAHLAHERILPYVDESCLVEIDDSIMDDPDYDFPLPNFTYQDTPQVEAVIHGEGTGKNIVFNAHLDVVPPSEGQVDAYNPIEENGKLYGRGAIDDKGGIATLFAVAMMLKENGIKPKGDIIFHFVVEEENGGNGTLAMVRRGVEADAAVVLEPSDLAIFPSVRGAVWFELAVFGRATHSGNIAGRISAVDKAYQAIEILRKYHDRLLEESRGLPLFDQYPDPMPLTIGQINGGNWPSSVPSQTVLKGLIGFLPNKNRHEVQAELRQALQIEGDEWLRENFEISFNLLNNDGNMLPVDHPLVTTLRDAALKNNLPGKIDAMVAACDAWQYANTLNIPTVVFGPGSLALCHAADEHILIDDMMKAASVLADFIVAYQ
jgi:acetylornithine deacetylase